MHLTYTAVFYADVVAGALIGLVALLFRKRHTSAARLSWAVAGSVVGAIGGGLVYLAFIAIAAVVSILSFFGEPMSASTILALSVASMLLAAGVYAARP